MRGRRTRILKKYNRRRSRCYSKKSKRHTRKNIYSKTYKKIQKGAGFFCKEYKKQIEECNSTKIQLLVENSALKQQNAFLNKESGKEISELNRTIISLRQDKYSLTSKIEELTKQKMPTEEEINAVTLDDNDMQQVEKMLGDWCAAYMKRETENTDYDPDRKSMDEKTYKDKNRELVIREYKIKKINERKS